MQRPNKKMIGGIALATVLVAGIFAITPQNASADLTALDKIGTIINIITDIQVTVTDILEDLGKKKQFWQRAENITDSVFVVGVFGSCPNLDLADCAFNVESLNIQNMTGFISGEEDLFVLVCPDFGCTITPVSGIGTSVPLLTGRDTIGASFSVVVVCLEGFFGEEDCVPEGVEFNGEKPQDMELTFFTATRDEPLDFTCFDGKNEGTTITCPEDLEDIVTESLKIGFSELLP